MPHRVERRQDGWFDTEREVFLPMLSDIYRAGAPGIAGFIAASRQMQRRIDELERRGA